MLGGGPGHYFKTAKYLAVCPRGGYSRLELTRTLKRYFFGIQRIDLYKYIQRLFSTFNSVHICICIKTHCYRLLWFTINRTVLLRYSVVLRNNCSFFLRSALGMFFDNLFLNLGLEKCFLDRDCGATSRWGGGAHIEGWHKTLFLTNSLK